MGIKITKGGTYKNANSHTEVLRALAQGLANHTLKEKIAADMTDNSGGTAAASLSAYTTLVNAANSGTNLAPKTGTETALTAIKDALLELATRANAAATHLGITGITYNGGGTAADGTIGAIGNSGTAASTGAQAASVNANLDTFDNALYQIARVTNAVCKAVGVTPLTLNYSKNLATTVSAITVGAGTAADPGITKVAMDAALLAYAHKIASVAAKLNAVRAIQVPTVVAE